MHILPVDVTHIPQGYLTNTGTIIPLPSASEATLKNMASKSNHDTFDWPQMLSYC